MRLHNLRIQNFRAFADFTLELQGKSAFLIGENGTGKSTVLAAISRAFGLERAFTKHDFRDLRRPIEIQCLLRDFTEEERAELAGAITFSEPPSLALLVRATWDPDLEEVETAHVLPDKNNRTTKPDERAAIPLVRLPAERDIARMLAFGIRRNMLGEILDNVDLETDLAAVTDLLAQANDTLGSAKALTDMIAEVTGHLARLRTGTIEHPLSIGHAASTVRELLGHLELHIADASDPIALRYQSSGIAQLVGFSFLFHRVQTKPGSIILIDEPETSLHPQAQRALMRVLDALDTQVLLATHSSNLLQRADARRILRLHRTADGVAVSTPRHLSDHEARKLARFTDPDTAEAFFARTVILVEGVSDKLALEALAHRRAKNLDSLGVTIVPLDGANTLPVFLKLLGPEGFQLHLVGLCDENKAAAWRTCLEEAKYGPVPDQAAMEALRFFTATRDLEDELVRALGARQLLTIIDSLGELPAWELFSGQPDQRGRPPEDQLRSFLQARDRKVRYAPILVDHLDLSRTPRALEAVLAHV